jgi:hypothetical protein
VSAPAKSVGAPERATHPNNNFTPAVSGHAREGVMKNWLTVTEGAEYSG